MSRTTSEPDNCAALKLLIAMDSTDHLSMLAALACERRSLNPQDSYNHRLGLLSIGSHQLATLADGSALAIKDGRFIFSNNGAAFAQREAPRHTVLPPFDGEPHEWKVPVHLDILPARDSQEPPENVLAAAVGNALPDMVNTQASVSGDLKQEALGMTFPNRRPEQVMGVMLQHYEGYGVMRPGEAYGILPTVAKSVNAHTKLQRRPRRRDGITVGGYAGLLSICEELLDLDWRVQSWLVDEDFISRRAAELVALLEPSQDSQLQTQ